MGKLQPAWPQAATILPAPQLGGHGQCGQPTTVHLPRLPQASQLQPPRSATALSLTSGLCLGFKPTSTNLGVLTAGETRGLYCKEHIEEGMVDVRHKHCMHPGCPKQATCNQPGAGGGMFCGQHKLEGMVNVVLKRCAHEGCETFPSFGHPGQPGVQYCRLHKLPGMTRRTSSSSAITFHPAFVHGLPATMSEDSGRITDAVSSSLLLS